MKKSDRRLLSDIRITLVNGAVGTFLCMMPISAIVVLGWIYRVMQRHVFGYWFAQTQDKAHLAKGFSAFMDSDMRTARFRYWPNWVKHQEGERIFKGGALRRGFRKRCGGLEENIRFGIEGLIGTYLVTLPILAVWIVMWWAGWIVSFHKSYEESLISTVASIISVFAFGAVMLYLPMAQARFAVTGEWRRFFDVKLIRTLTRHARFKSMFLAILYSLGAAGILLGRDVVPLFIENVVGFDARETEALKAAWWPRYVYIMLAFFTGYLVLRIVNARVYASAVLKALQAGAIAPDDLSVLEQGVLRRLGMLKPGKPVERNLVARSMAWVLAKCRTVLTVGVQYGLWLAVAFIIYVGQFLNHDWYEWLSHPLVHIPYIGYHFGNPYLL